MFRTIGEVAEDLDLPAHVLRFWESKFPQLKPLKRGGGRRYYRPEDIALLSRIRQCLYQEGYTIRGVQKLLVDGNLGASGGAQDIAPSLFPLDPIPASAAAGSPARPGRASRRATAQAAVPVEVPQLEPIIIAEPQPVGLSPGGKAALEAAAQELLSARQLLEALLQSRRRD
ncbi:MAG TPA: MerR family transcriptional regulator [Stellaceae bacterium]|nr:MerR family transcriptional regulator [Stellaceae bacterium]